MNACGCYFCLFKMDATFKTKYTCSMFCNTPRLYQKMLRDIRYRKFCPKYFSIERLRAGGGVQKQVSEIYTKNGSFFTKQFFGRKKEIYGDDGKKN